MGRALVRGSLLVLLILLVTGCGAVVHPPTKALDPVAVYVADYGVHSAIMLPLGNNRYVEYAFGDWGYCAKNQVGINDALGALFLSSESAFGRRYIDMKPGQRYPTPRTPLPKSVFAVYVPRESVLAVEKKFDERFNRALHTLVHNPTNDTDYVRDDQNYSFANSCNHMTATTLRYLGCQVDGFTFFSAFRYSPTPSHDSHPLIEPHELPIRPQEASAID